MTFEEAKHIHIMGIGGIGVSAIGRLALHLKKEVSGCDVEMTAITKDLAAKGVKVARGHDSAHVIATASAGRGGKQSQSEIAPSRTPRNDGLVDLLVYSPAVPENNPERVKARELGVTEMSYPEVLGELSKQYKTIAVAGTNGKTTTTAMVGLALEALGMDPTVIVGSNVKQWDGNFRAGFSPSVIASEPQGERGNPGRDCFAKPRNDDREKGWLVVEACEWNAHFLHLEPYITVITNIEPDHLDYYRDINHIVETFQELVNKAKGIVIINADDVQSKRLLITKSATFSAGDADVPKLLIPGVFNRANAAAALAVVRAVGGDVAKAAQALAQYRGAWRRFEVLGEFNGATIVSDYGHHPTAVRGTIQAAREFYPGRRIVVAFHPHHQNRTKTLFNEFVESFDDGDVILINEIFRVPGREQFKDEEISSQQLVDAVAARGKDAYFSPDLAHTEEWLRTNLKAGDVALIMGAGDIYKVAEKLV